MVVACLAANSGCMVVTCEVANTAVCRVACAKPSRPCVAIERDVRAMLGRVLDVALEAGDGHQRLISRGVGLLGQRQRARPRDEIGLGRLRQANALRIRAERAELEAVVVEDGIVLAAGRPVVDSPWPMARRYLCDHMIDPRILGIGATCTRTPAILLRSISRRLKPPSSSTEHGRMAVSTVGEPAKELSEGRKISSLRHSFRWIPTAFGLKKTLSGEDDEEFSLQAITLPPYGVRLSI